MSEELKYSRLSWEPEMFISGGLVFTLFQIPSWLLSIKLSLEPTGGIAGINELLAILSLAFAILTIGFVLHLIIKTIWVGMNAFNYSHGKNLTSSSIKLSALFNKYNEGSLEDYVLRINRIAGLMFGTSVFLLISILGIAIHISLMMAFFYLTSLPEHYFSYFLFPLLLYLFDNLSFGLLKRNKIVSSIYYPFYLVVSATTFSFIYRSMHYSLLANHSKARIIGLIFSMILLSLPLTQKNAAKVLNIGNLIQEQWQFYDNSGFITNARTVASLWYLDKFESDDRIIFLAIESDYADKDVLKMYFNYKQIDELFPNTNSSDLEESQFQELINSKIIITIKDEVVNGKWKFQYYKKTNQYTLVKELEIFDLNKGRYVLNIDIPETSRKWYQNINVEFWKE
ncbi:MAG: hypothetical protein OEW67_06335 [Cyclobacteriaceae bacterium]|nr:hypothetical protein [Cyclobacteriaceae bacterium]